METFNALLTRRSIRKYDGEKISEEKIDDILKAAMYAPSGFNLQPWEFLVIDEKKVIDGIREVIPYAEMLRLASHAIVVCGDNEKEKNIEFLIQDCSAAIQNLLLASHDAGLGACWIAVCGMPDITEGLKNHFKLPGNIIPIAVISLGYADESPAAEDRFIKEKIHFNKW
ncbi:MAG: nitroreductase family protein [Ignavibacteriaceae bacterium]